MTPVTRRLEGKRAIITGAGSGIGRATAVRFALEGCRVAVVDRNEQATVQTASIIRETSREVMALHADVAAEAEIEAAIRTASDAWGGLDIVVANAGIELAGRDTIADRLELDVWHQLLEVNLTGQFLTCKHGIRQLLQTGKGAVVCVGSPCGFLGICFEEPGYSASKGGVLGMMRVLAFDYAKLGIRVNMVVPGLIDTPMSGFVMQDSDLLSTSVAAIPLGRAGKPEEIANIILFLASDEASYCVGSVFVADGGLTAI